MHKLTRRCRHHRQEHALQTTAKIFILNDIFLKKEVETPSIYIKKCMQPFLLNDTREAKLPQIIHAIMVVVVCSFGGSI
jgi:hypothetical protein